MLRDELIASAWAVRERAYAPFSKFRVGAALETESGAVFNGCNVENLSFGLTSCAERNAVFSAVAAGEQRFKRIFIVSDSEEPVTPCGACRQVLAEFADDLEVTSINLSGAEEIRSLAELLPRAKAGIMDRGSST